jgi:hypothetical protein
MQGNQDEGGGRERERDLGLPIFLIFQCCDSSYNPSDQSNRQTRVFFVRTSAGYKLLSCIPVPQNVLKFYITLDLSIREQTIIKLILGDKKTQFE